MQAAELYNIAMYNNATSFSNRTWLINSELVMHWHNKLAIRNY